MNSNLATIIKMIDERKATQKPKPKSGFQAKWSEITKGDKKAKAKPSSTENAFDRDDMAAMLAEIDLLGLIQSDTGESGRKSGSRIDFKSCPICGHRDCFKFYPLTNSWSCFGDSNTTGYTGGSCLEYYKATRTDDDVEAVRWLREETGHPYEGEADKATDTAQDEASSDRWLIVDTDIEHLPAIAPELIAGLLRVGRKGIIAGASKSHKSWLALNLAISVATGGRWLDFTCRQGRVLYLNMEIAADSFPHRIEAVAKAKGVTNDELGNLKRIDMRGFYEGAEQLKTIIFDQAKHGDFDLILLDPLYKAFNGDENKANEVAQFCKVIDQICEGIGCAFVYVHHHSKGAKGDVASIDRASGSGVFARDPDFICDVTRIEPADEADNLLADDERAYLLTFDLREFVSPPPIHVIYSDRLHRIDTEGITESWKPRSASGRNRGGKATAEVNKAKAEAESAMIVARLAAGFYSQAIGADGLILKDAAELADCTSQRLVTAIGTTDLFEVVQISQRKRFVVATNPPPTQPPEAPTLDLGSD